MSVKAYLVTWKALEKFLFHIEDMEPAEIDDLVNKLEEAGYHALAKGVENEFLKIRIGGSGGG